MAGTYGFWFARHRAERGDVHTWAGTPVPGRARLHAATSPLAALPYANSDRLCRVSLHGTIRAVGDQMAATTRRVEYALDAGAMLRELARRWIERLLGQPIGDRARHLREASAARERVLELDERIRDARWALEEGARSRTPSDIARFPMESSRSVL